MEALQKERSTALSESQDTQAALVLALQRQEDAEGMCAQLDVVAQDLEAKVARQEESMASSVLLIRKLERSVEALTKSGEDLGARYSGEYPLPLRFSHLSPLDFASLTPPFSSTELSSRLEAETARRQEVAAHLDALRVAATNVLTQLELPVTGDPIGLAEGLGGVVEPAGALSTDMLRRGVYESFYLARSHYSTIALPEMVEAGVPVGYSKEELARIDELVSEPADRFVELLTQPPEAAPDSQLGPDAPQE